MAQHTHRNCSYSLVDPVGKDNDEQAQYYRSRDVPLFKSVFHQFDKPCPKHDAMDDPEKERASTWLELSGDLAWSAAFGSLTNNRKITGTESITNYAIFFALMWLLWGSQVAYEIKYWTKDWWHRVVFTMQLLSYGTLASFTADFDVFWRFRDISDEVFTENVSILTGATMLASAQRARELSLEGVSFVMYANRLMLLLQYLIVERHRSNCKVFSTFDCNWCSSDISGKTSHDKRCWHYYSIPISIGASAMMFMGGHLTMRLAPLTRTTSSVLFGLWLGAIVTEALGYASSPLCDERRGHSNEISRRLSNLTVVIMGEGLNSIFSVTKHTVNAVGVGPKLVAILLSLGIALYGIWACYFEDHHSRLPKSKLRREIWFLLHFVFHLVLIMVLEGLKNMILQTSLVISMEVIYDAFRPNGLNETVHTAALVKVLEKLGLSWSQFNLEYMAAFKRGDTAAKLWYQRFVLKVFYKLFYAYQDIGAESTYRVEEYGKDDAKVLADLAHVTSTGNWGPTFQAIIKRLEKPLYDATTYLVPLTGAVVFVLALLNIVQRTPTDRWGWGTAITKIIGGTTLIFLVIVHINISQGPHLGATVWRIPTLAISLWTIILVQLVLLKFAVRSFGAVKNPDEEGLLPPSVPLDLTIQEDARSDGSQESDEDSPRSSLEPVISPDGEPSDIQSLPPRRLSVPVSSNAPDEGATLGRSQEQDTGAGSLLLEHVAVNPDEDQSETQALPASPSDGPATAPEEAAVAEGSQEPDADARRSVISGQAAGDLQVGNLRSSQ